MDIQKVCQKCKGTGEVRGEPTVTCDRCGGSGRLDEGEISDAINTLSEKLDDIMDKCIDIFEKLNE